MATRDWFRKSTWTEADRADFEARLARARPASRAQYLRIQAAHLEEAGEHRGALALLDRMLSDYPDRLEVAQGHLQRATVLDALNSVDAATEAFRAAIITEREIPNAGTQVWFQFPSFIAERRLRALYGEALEVLADVRTKEMFPVDRFLAAAVRAIIHADLGDLQQARGFAKMALAAAEETRSGFSRHPSIGLVADDHPLLRDVRRIVR